jgi:hypothetical protein
MKAIIVFFNEARTDFIIVGPFKDGEAGAEIKRLKTTYVSGAIREINLINMIEPGAVR